MEYKEFCKNFMRMCGYYDFCFECQLENKYKEKDYRGCSAWCIAHPQEAEQILEQWKKEHPVVTNADKFKEAFGRTLVNFAITNSNEQRLTIYGLGNREIAEWMEQEYKEPKEDDN